MNECNENFLKINGIIPEETSSKVDSLIHTQSEINPIVYDYEFQEGRKTEEVSVADIVGLYCKRGSSNNIFESLDDYFDSYGDGYHTRSVGMLEYNKDTIIEGLKKSFEAEPIVVQETGEGSYTILTNGLHRFTILRILYLKEFADANWDAKKIMELKEKYSIPVEVVSINLEKTYCKYILEQIGIYNLKRPEIKSIESEYKDYKQTGNVEIKYYSGEKESITQEELKNRTIEMLRQVIQNEGIPFYISRALKYPSFRNFVSENIPDIYKLIEEQERGNK